MKTNTAVRTNPVYTHEGGRASRISPLAQLERSVLSCLLWEDSFYENGVSVADRIGKLVAQCSPADVSEVAQKARTEFKLRHVPLLIAAHMAKNGYTNTADTIAAVIQRADELAELPSIYWKLNGPSKNGQNVPLSAQMKKGLARAFTKFDAYQLAKYNRDSEVKLRDVLFLCHAKPKDEAQEAIWKQLVDGTLPAPDTWEVSLSAGADKGQTFTRLLQENKLGYMALLRNLRNMDEAKVNRDLICRSLLEGASRSKALPFRFIAALRHAPMFASVLDEAMQRSLQDMERLPGRTVIAVDVSGSMSSELSRRSQMRCNEAAAAVAILLRGICPDTRVIGFGSDAQEIPAFQGLAIAEHLRNFGNVVGCGTEVGRAAALANRLGYDRVIIITDEQSRDNMVSPLPGTKAYIVNVASYENGIGYGQWTHINGFSEGVVRYMQEIERAE